MKILYLTLGLPDPPVVGPQIRDFELYRRIAARHEVRVVALTETAPPTPPREDRVGRVYPLVVPTALGAGLLPRLKSHLAARRPAATLPFVTEPALARLRAIVCEWRPHLVQIEHSFLAPYLSAVDPAGGTRTILSLHNVGAIQFGRLRQIARGPRQRLAARLKARSMNGWEVPWCARFDRVVAVSPDDRGWLLERDPRLTIDVVPNGVDAALPPLPPSHECELLFVGNMAYPPNVDAVRYFCEAIFPLIRRRLPEARFTVAGFDPPASLSRLARRYGVKLVDSAPDLRPWYERAAICVVPLRAGGGTRLKILEAMALGRPVVSTVVGCEGLQVCDGEHLVIADDPERFARAVVDLYRRPREARRLASNARRLCEEAYSWDVIAHRLEQVYCDVLRT